MNASLIPPTPPSVAAQVARLPDLPLAELKPLWHQLFNTPMPIRRRSFLVRQMAYRLQEIEGRRADPTLFERNAQRIAAWIERDLSNRRHPRDILMPGTVLTREYRGVEYHVLVRADGQYEFNGQPYASLSRIAREITGTRWSGWAFFGLRPTPSRQGHRS